MTAPPDRKDAERSGPETERGRALFEELLWVHSIIRRDRKIVEQLAGRPTMRRLDRLAST